MYYPIVAQRKEKYKKGKNYYIYIMVKSKVTWINPNLTKTELLSLKKWEREQKKSPFITYRKGGRVDRHKSLLKAKIVARGQALKGRRGFVDTDKGKFVRTIVVFEPRRKRIKRKRRR